MEKLRLWWIPLLLAFVFVITGTPLYAEPQFDEVIDAETADVEAIPVMEEGVALDEMPVPTDEQRKKQEDWQLNTNLPGPELVGNPEPMYLDGPNPDTESFPGDLTAAPGDNKIWLKTRFGPRIPSTEKSNIMESSVATRGRWIFFTGNWFAARGRSGGTSPSDFTYINPYVGWPSWNQFCCDQLTIYDASRNLFFWLRMSRAGTNPNTGNYENTFKLSVSKLLNGDPRGPFEGPYITYNFTPTGTNGAWTNQWWDYPHMQLGTDYLYITWNMFTQAGSFARSVILRLPLDALAAGSAFSYNYYNTTAWSTFVPVQGSKHRMYFGSNWPNTVPQNSRILILSWNEDSTGLGSVVKTVTTWTFTNRGNAVCGSPNWAARYDQRILAGARYSIMNTNVKYPGRKVIGFWWNVQEGGSFPYPYIEAAAFFEDDLTQVPGTQGRPLIWNSNTCFAYPSVAANKRQDLGVVFNYATSPIYHRPKIGVALADDFSAAPAGWTYYFVEGSQAGPSDSVWGDYNTCRVFSPTEDTWVGGAHYIDNTTNCSRCAEPLYFTFGRDRDSQAYFHWYRR